MCARIKTVVRVKYRCMHHNRLFGFSSKSKQSWFLFPSQLEYWYRDGQATCFEFWPPQTGEVLKYKEGDWQIPSKYLQIVRTGKGQRTDHHIHAAQYLRNAATTLSQDSKLQNNMKFMTHFSFQALFWISQYKRGAKVKRKAWWRGVGWCMGGAWIKSCILGQSRQRRGFSTMWKGEEGGSRATVS